MISYFSDAPPFSPCTPMDFGFFRKFPVRRALLELGSTDPKLNRRMAESLLTISAEKFISKWNFDPVNMKPREGKYIWTPVKRDSTIARSIRNNKSSCTESTPVVESHQPQTCDRIPHPEDIPEDEARTSSSMSPILNKETNQPFDDLATAPPPQLTSILLSPRPDRQIVKPSSRCAKTPMGSPSLQTRQPTTPKSRQSKITEYGRQRKRLYSNSKSDEEIDFSPRKKLLLEASPKVTSPTISVLLE